MESASIPPLGVARLANSFGVSICNDLCGRSSL